MRVHARVIWAARLWQGAARLWHGAALSLDCTARTNACNVGGRLSLGRGTCKGWLRPTLSGQAYIVFVMDVRGSFCLAWTFLLRGRCVYPCRGPGTQAAPPRCSPRTAACMVRGVCGCGPRKHAASGCASTNNASMHTSLRCPGASILLMMVMAADASRCLVARRH